MVRILLEAKHMYSFFDGEIETHYDSVTVDGKNVNFLKNNKVLLTIGDELFLNTFPK